MKKLAMFAAAAAIAPFGLSASTIVTNGGGPYDISSDTLFTAIVVTDGGPGSYIIDFFNSSDDVLALASAAVTTTTVSDSFDNLEMSWFNAVELGTIVQLTGVTVLSTVFDAEFPEQTLRFEWTDSVAGSGFRADVVPTMVPSAIPLPASVLLLGSALGGLGLLRGRRKLAGLRAA